VTDKNWTFSLDGKDYQFGVMFEVIELPEDKDYRFVTNPSICSNDVHRSFDESDDGDAGKLALLLDCFSYMGGVGIDHILNNMNEEKDLKELKALFKKDEAIITEDFLAFKDNQTPKRLIDFLIKERCQVLGVMIGFILDQPINRMGDNGWSQMKKQIYGV